MPTDFRLDNGFLASAEPLAISRHLHVVCLKCGLIVDRRRKSTDLRSPEELHARVQCGNCFARAASGDVIFSFDHGVTFHERAQEMNRSLLDEAKQGHRPEFAAGGACWQHTETVDHALVSRGDAAGTPASPHTPFWRSSLEVLTIAILMIAAVPLVGLVFDMLKLTVLTYGVLLDP